MAKVNSVIQMWGTMPAIFSRYVPGLSFGWAVIVTAPGIIMKRRGVDGNLPSRTELPARI